MLDAQKVAGPDEAMVYAYDRAHHVRLIISVRDGVLAISGDWRHTDRDTWHDVDAFAVSRYLVAPQAHEIASVRPGDDELWEVAKLVGGLLTRMGDGDDLGLITRCRQ